MSIDSRAKLYGKVFGDWTIRNLVGHGSGGKTAVFKLTRNNLTYEETCAMKVVNIAEQKGRYDELSEDFQAAYDQQEKNLCQEAENEVSLMYQLRGAGNIVSYLDYYFEKWEDESSFGTDLLIRMDYLQSLGDMVKCRQMAEEEIVKIGIDMCHALEVCHSSGILHRDIKPDNIFYNRHQMYLLGDFGISRMLDEAECAETKTGTKPYAAPEQFAGHYDRLADIYSLGLTLYDLANGHKLPFADSPFVKMADIQLRLNGKAIPKPELVSEELGRIILKACEFKPELRYQSAEEFKAALLHMKDRKRKEEGREAFAEEDMYATEAALSSETDSVAEEELYVTEPALSKEPAFAEAEDMYATEAALSSETDSVAEEELYATEPALSKEPDLVEAEDRYTTEAAGYVEHTEETEEEWEIPETEDCAEEEEELSAAEDLEADVTSMGREYYDHGDFDKAVSWYKKGIARKDPEAMYELAVCYMNGQGVEIDMEAALHLLMNCSERTTDRWQQSLADLRIAQIYEKQAKSRKDYKVVEQWYRKSAEAGNPYAKKRFRGGRFLK